MLGDDLKFLGFQSSPFPILKAHKMKEETRQMVRFSKDVSRMRQEKQENKQQMCPDMFFCFPLAFFFPP